MFARSIAAIVTLFLVTGCAKPPPEFEDVPPAEELYQEGQKILEGTRILGVWPYVNYGKAIETFQAIIDNYPYSEYAVLAEQAIADTYFEDEKYDEALSYYRDFTDLHPQHEKVPVHDLPLGPLSPTARALGEPRPDSHARSPDLPRPAAREVPLLGIRGQRRGALAGAAHDARGAGAGHRRLLPEAG